MAITDNLVAGWKLNEASGNAVDFVGPSTMTGVNSPGSAAGKILGARDFEADSTQLFTTASTAALVTGDVDFEIGVWANIESKSGNRGILAKATSSDFEYLLFYDSSADRFSLWVQTAAGGFNNINANTFGAASLGTWCYVHAFHDSVNDVLGISINGASPDTRPHSAGVKTSSAPVQIGAFDTSGGSKFDGQLEQMLFWKRVLSNGERTTLYNGGAGMDISLTTSGLLLKRRKVAAA